MSRDNRPRAWYKPLGVMIQPEQVESINYETKTIGVYMVLDGKGFHRLRRSDFILMWPTGLSDKNGKEIYEVDVLDGSYVSPLSQETVKRHFVVAFEKGNYYAQMIGHHPYGTTMLYFENEKSKIIGNICEHPHLLGGEGRHNETKV